MSHVHGQALHARAPEVNEADGPVRLDGLDDGDVSELVIATTVLVAIPGVAEEGDVSDIGTLPLVEDAEILRLLVEHPCISGGWYARLYVRRADHAGAVVPIFVAVDDQLLLVEKTLRGSGNLSAHSGPATGGFQMLWLHDLRRYVGNTLRPHAAGGSGYAQPTVREASDEQGDEPDKFHGNRISDLT